MSYAKQYLEQINGSIHIHSNENIGTKIRINLLRANHPIWFCESISIAKITNIVVLDDDNSIHAAWDDRFSQFSGVKMFHCYNTTHLSQYKFNHDVHTVYLIDYELRDDVKNGLEIIEELDLKTKSILVTSCFEDISLRARCENMGVKIIPKSYVPYINIIQNQKDENTHTMVFIDDDEMMRMTWSFAAEEVGQQVSTYSSFDEFLNEITKYDKDTLIYIDSDLGNNIKGEDCAKFLFDTGFLDIHLSTAHSPEKFNQMYWIKTIVGKVPPFEF